MSASSSHAKLALASVVRPGSNGQQTVEFYETERFLVDTVNRFVADGLRRGEATIVIAAPSHRRAFEVSLTAAGIDVIGARDAGRYIELDERDTLARFMIGGRLDAGRFRDTVTALIEQAERAAHGVRIYSEMVARLWNDRNEPATIALGELWQSLEAAHDFALLCAYPMRAFAGEASDAVFDAICGQYASVIPSDPYPLEGSDQDRQRAVAKLQREVVELRATVARVRADQERSEQLAHVDPLTGLGNRRAFDRHARREWQLSRRNGADTVLVLADLDFFKDYNDASGHAAGDEVLCQFADLLHTAARNTDILCRIGGDEFAILLIDAGDAGRRAFLARLHALLGAAGTGSVIGALGVSFGHCSLLAAQTASQAFEHADSEMYAAKRRAHVEASRERGRRTLREHRRGRPADRINQPAWWRWRWRGSPVERALRTAGGDHES